MAQSIILGGRTVGEDHPPFIIAEACINHEGDIAIAREMVVAAKAMGADAVKFQYHVLEDEMLPAAPKSSNFDEPLWQALERTNLALSEHKELKSFCQKTDIQYLCTPFSKKSADILDQNNLVDYFKVGSGELTNIPLQRHIASKGKPMIVSTGMSEPSEILETVTVLNDAKVNYALMHCVSIYPCPPSRMNLGLIPRYKEQFKVPIGLSDHTASIYTAIGAVALGASIIEKHFTLDRSLPGPDHTSSIEPDELGQLVEGCRAVFEARGAERKIFPEEQQIVAWARESVVSVQDIPSGSIISSEMVTVKRPGPGPGVFPARELESVIDSVALVDISAGKQILRSEVTK